MSIREYYVKYLQEEAEHKKAEEKAAYERAKSIVKQYKQEVKRYNFAVKGLNQSVGNLTAYGPQPITAISDIKSNAAKATEAYKALSNYANAAAAHAPYLSKATLADIAQKSKKASSRIGNVLDAVQNYTQYDSVDEYNLANMSAKSLEAEINRLKSTQGIKPERIQQLETLLPEKQRVEKETYMRNTATSAPDYTTLSRPNTSIGDITYKYINNINDIRNSRYQHELMVDRSTAYMTDDERGTYNWYYAKYGKKEADSYLESIKADLLARYNSAKTREAAEYAERHPILATLKSVPNMVMGGTYAATDQTIKRLTGKPINPNEYTALNTAQAARQAVSDKIGNGVGQFLYGTGTSLGDTAFAIATTRQAAIAPLGATAMASTVNDALERGATQGQAYFAGLAAGAAEAIFERFSIGNIFDSFRKGAGKSLVKSVLKQSGIEASEEAATEIANIISDKAIMGDLSNYNLAVNSYKSQGMSDAEAKKQAKLDLVSNIAQAALGGALSGAVFGGGVAGVQRIQNKAAATEAKKVVDELYKNPTNDKIFKVITEQAVRDEFENRSGIKLSGKGPEMAKTIKREVSLENEGKNFTNDEYKTLVSQKSTSLDFQDMEKYTPKQRGIIKEFLNSVDERIKQAVETYRQNKNAPFRRFKISDVTQREANDIKRLLGVDVSGYEHSINKNAFEHIENRHGVQGEADMTMANANDLARIGYVLNNYDTVERAKDQNGKPAFSNEFMDKNDKPAPLIKYSKKIDGAIYVVEAVAENKWNKVWVTTAYVNKKDGLTQAPHATKTLGVTSETLLASHPSSDTNVSRNENGVNSSIHEDGEKDTQSYKKGSDRSKWAATSKNDVKVQVQALSKIIDEARKYFGIPISSGKVRKPDVLGIYKTKAEAIRTQVANDIPVISHEIGHHLDKMYKLRELPSIKEAIDAMDDNFKSLYSQEEIPGEAVAEFVRIYMTDKALAKVKYPQMYKDFESTLSEKDLAFVSQMADKVNAYMSATYMERAKASIVSRLDKDNTPLSERIENLKDMVICNFQNSAYPIKKYFGDKAFVIYSHSLDADAIVKSCVDIYLPDMKGQKIADSLQDILKPISKDYEDFDLYLKLNHALEYSEFDMRAFADETLQDKDKMREAISELESNHPEFKETAEKVYNYQRQLVMHWLVEPGLLTKEAAEAMFEKFPHYVPFFRKTSELNLQTGVRRALANKKAPIKRAKGGGQDTYSPIENILFNLNSFIKTALRNDVMKEIVRQSKEIEGMGNIIEKVPPNVIPKTVSLNPILKAVENMNIEGVNIDDIKTFFNETFEDGIVEFGISHFQGKDIVSFRNNGQTEYYQVHDKPLVQALMAMNPKEVGLVTSGLSTVSRAFRSLATSKNPFFAPVNFLRDAQTAYHKGDRYNPIKFTKELMDAVKDQIQKSDSYKLAKASGLGYFTPISSPKSLKTLLDGIKDNSPNTIRKILKTTIVHPLEAMASIQEAVELAPRLAEFKRTLSKYDMITQEAINETMYAANNITTNFKIKGNEVLSPIIPFFNPDIQGKVSTIEYLRKKPVAMLSKMVTTGIITSLIIHALATVNGDDEEYDKLSTYQKNNYYNFSIGNGRFIRIPKARELSIISSLFERAIEAMKGDMDKDDWKDFASYIVDNIMPPIEFSDWIINGFYDLAINKDFKGAPIVPSNLEKFEKRAQYDETSTAYAKIIGNVFNISPKKIDFLISNYFGGAARIGKALFADRKDFTFGVVNTFVSDSAYSTDVLNRFYDKLDRLYKAQNTYQYNGAYACEYAKYYFVSGVVREANKFANDSSISKKRQRELRIAIRDYVDDFMNAQPQPYEAELIKIAERTKEMEILRIPTAESVISINKKEVQLSFDQYIDYVDEYQSLLSATYANILSKGYSDEQVVDMIKRAKIFIKKSLNQKYFDIVVK